MNLPFSKTLFRASCFGFNFSGGLRWARIFFLLVASGAQTVFSQPTEPAAQPEPKRPRVALVLSGGGARGFAHIGVLRVLRELHVPVDIVVGTSMGCVVGGAYAAGQSIEELEKMARTTDWDRVVADRPARNELTFRRRDEDLELPSRIEFGVSREGLTLPPAAAGNAALDQTLTKMLPVGTRDLPANRLALPFRSVASDLLTGELVELSDTPLYLTIRASLSMPGVFAPVRVNGRLLVDGGLVRNLPVDLARALGADIVIAVNVGTPLAKEHELGSSLALAQQMLRILTIQNVRRSLNELGPRDILVTPDLETVTFMDFRAYERAMKAGADATYRMAAQLQALALPADLYAAQDNRRQAPTERAGALPLGHVAIEGIHRINPVTLIAQSGLKAGEPVTPEQVRQAASRLYGRADVDVVATEVSDASGERNVTLRITEADWASRRLRLGLELTSDFSDSSSYSIVGMHVASSLNDWGAEMRTIARIGTRRSISSEWWQPLGAGADWYAASSAGYGAGASDVFEAGRRQIRVGVKGAQLGLALGKQLGEWGDLRAGVTRNTQRARRLIPEDPSLGPETLAETSRFLLARIDTLEPIAFPVRGQLLQVFVTQPINPRDLNSDATRSQVVGLAAFELGGWGGHVYGEWTHSQGGYQPLGGFLRLSGSPPQSVDGSTTVFGRLVLARRIGSLAAPFGSAIRAGFSLEAGGGYAAGQPIRFSDLKEAGSLFLSLDTRFGPLYFPGGGTRNAGSTFYLFLGPIW